MILFSGTPRRLAAQGAKQLPIRFILFCLQNNVKLMVSMIADILSTHIYFSVIMSAAKQPAFLTEQGEQRPEFRSAACD